ncbi:hypothetical protein ACLOJK_004668 [Asimina triloba]
MFHKLTYVCGIPCGCRRFRFPSATSKPQTSTHSFHLGILPAANNGRGGGWGWVGVLATESQIREKDIPPSRTHHGTEADCHAMRCRSIPTKVETSRGMSESGRHRASAEKWEEG